jgi:hypothetical protein
MHSLELVKVVLIDMQKRQGQTIMCPPKRNHLLNALLTLPPPEEAVGGGVPPLF